MLRFGLIGYPLGHSLSDGYLNACFAQLGIKARYSHYPLPDLKGLSGLLKDVRLKGFNVTIPHKQTIVPLLDALTEEAAAIGAANAVFVDDTAETTRLTGHNTDAQGFRMSLEAHDVKLKGHALILGTGGAARAAAFVLREAGMQTRLVSRKPGPGVIAYNELTNDEVVKARLIVNATPLGMIPDHHSFPPILYDSLHSGQTLFDMVYNPEVTVFLQEGKAKGTQCIGGLGMLHNQAELSLAWWLEKIGERT